MKNSNQTDKQQLQVMETYLVWDGRAWVTMYDILEQPSGKPYTAIQSTHMTGSIMGWTFISDNERQRMAKLTFEKLNS